MVKMKYKVRLKCEKRNSRKDFLSLKIPENAKEHDNIIKASLEASEQPINTMKVGKE